MKRFLAVLLIILGALAVHGSAWAQNTVNAEPAIPQSKAQIALSFAPLVKQVQPAVVNIYTQRLVKQRLSPLFEDPFFRQFFGDPALQGLQRQRMENSLGSGVIVKADGLIVTARHVIADADQIRVGLADRREFDAKVIMSDEASDLAILRIDTKGAVLPYIELRDSDEAQVGDLVLAIGNPFGVGQTVTMGIISALTHKQVGDGEFDYFIQTDAAINPGNSGGALVTMDGKLVGINASIYSRDGGSMGIGFAVPSNLVRAMIRAVSEGKKGVVHPWTGIEGQEITPDIATSLGLGEPSGFLVKSLDAASPAAKAGIKVGDLIVALNGRAVEDLEDFRYRVATMPVGVTVTIGINRHGQKMDFEVPLIAPPETVAPDKTTVTGQNPVSGADIANLSPAIAERAGLRGEGKGVVVLAIHDGTPASLIGLQQGDILEAINGKAIVSVSDALAALHQPTRVWRMTILRDGNEINMMFRS